MRLLIAVLMFVLSGCVSIFYAMLRDPVTLTRLPDPIVIEATRNYLPTISMGIMTNPAYTIYDRSQWECAYRVGESGFGCCSVQPFGTMSPWKYCVVTDAAFQPFAFLELGTSEQGVWPDGKQAGLFRRISAP